MRLIIFLGLEIYKTEIIKAVVTEFVRRKLHIKYHKEIEEWKKYIREQKFAIKLDRQVRIEISRFRKEIKRWTIKELEVFVIEGLDCLKKGKDMILFLPPAVETG